MNIQGDVTSVSSYFNAEISMTYKKETMSLKTIAIYDRITGYTNWPDKICQ